MLLLLYVCGYVGVLILECLLDCRVVSMTMIIDRLYVCTGRTAPSLARPLCRYPMGMLLYTVWVGHFLLLFFDGQGVFLSEWDGLTQGINAGPVVVLGATNRPLDLDQVRCCHTLLRTQMILRYNI